MDEILFLLLLQAAGVSEIAADQFSNRLIHTLHCSISGISGDSWEGSHVEAALGVKSYYPPY